MVHSDQASFLLTTPPPPTLFTCAVWWIIKPGKGANLAVLQTLSEETGQLLNNSAAGTLEPEMPMALTV